MTTKYLAHVQMYRPNGGLEFACLVPQLPADSFSECVEAVSRRIVGWPETGRVTVTYFKQDSEEVVLASGKPK